MAAKYASVISLLDTIERLRSHPRILLPEFETDLLYACLRRFEQILNCLYNDDGSCKSNEAGDSLGSRLKELFETLEDEIESNVSDAWDSLSESSKDSEEGEILTVVFSLPALQIILQLVDLHEELKLTPLQTLIDERQQPTRFSAADVVSWREVDHFNETIELVGRDAQFRYVRLMLSQIRRNTHLITIVLHGMAGIGKTALAKKILQDPVVEDHYNHLLFLSIGPQYRLTKCLLSALYQLGYLMDDSVFALDQELDEALAKFLYEVLCKGSYLIVLDDVWDEKVLDDLKMCFPDENYLNGIILTTRRGKVAKHDNVDHLIEMRLLRDDYSWDLLRKIVFSGEEPSIRPDHQLEKLGKKIAENCEGLPLAIIEIGKLLRADKTVENWKKVSEDENPLNIKADDDSPISRTLTLSYDKLSLFLKVNFLYMGLFPKGYDITFSKLSNLWISEGFHLPRVHLIDGLSLRQTNNLSQTKLHEDCLILCTFGTTGGFKTCRLHFVYRALCASMAQNENLFHIISKYVNCFHQGINNSRRLSIHNKALVSFKQVQSSMESASSLRSLLFFGQKDQQPLRVYLGYRLLRVLDALTIRFYEFPHDAVNLFHLRYLAIKYGGPEIPPSISRLWNLETLIILPHHHLTNYAGGPVYLPVEIWKLCRLTFLKCVGFDLPDPSSIEDGHNLLVLEQLQTLSGVSAHSCTKGVLARLPNLLKLGIQIVRGLILDAAVETSLDFFGDIADLCGSIESFTCVVLKPDHGSHPVSSIPNFHVNITKLNLSGCGIRWENMEYIGRLPNLMALKLRLYAFQGPEWETVEGGFGKLNVLELEDLDIERWKVGNGDHFPSLSHLFIKHCYKLQEIPFEIGDIATLESVTVVDCNPRAYQRLEEKISTNLWIFSTWEDKKLWQS